MIEVKNINKTFGKNKVLDDVSFTFKSGKTNLVIGASGSGKTTLIKCMVGLHKPDSGKILFNNQSIDELDKKSRRKLRKEIGMLFQGGALFDYLNVEENIAFPLNMFTKMSQKEKTDRVNFCLKKVTNLVLPLKVYR